MAGLAADPAHFFKFLFILALYTLAMTLFVRTSPLFPSFYTFAKVNLKELPSRNRYQQRRYRHPSLRSFRALPDDICRLLRSPQLHPTCSALVAMALSSQIYPRGAVGE